MFLFTVNIIVVSSVGDTFTVDLIESSTS